MGSSVRTSDIPVSPFPIGVVTGDEFVAFGLSTDWGVVGDLLQAASPTNRIPTNNAHRIFFISKSPFSKSAFFFIQAHMSASNSSW